MASAIFTADDGSVVNLFDQAHVDAAVATAVAAVPAGAPVVIDEVDVKESNGSTEVFNAPDAQEATETPAA